MASVTEVKVPDIGDFKEVEVIEVLVKPGDAVAKEQSLITLESDKATMEIPSPAAGVVRELTVKVGDKVSQGTVILTVDEKGEETGKEQKEEQKKPAATQAPAAAGEIECDLVVLGAGPGGYSAAFRAADLGLKTVLVERYPALGGVGLNVGCIPSKALLHTAAIVDAARGLSAHGVSFAEPKLDLDKLRAFKDKVVGKLSGGVASMAKLRKVMVLQGIGTFADANRLKVETKNGAKLVRFGSAIIAAGSQAAKLPFDTVYVPGSGGIALDLKRNIRAGTDAKVVDNPKNAQAVMQFTREERQKVILSLTATGRVGRRLSFDVSRETLGCTTGLDRAGQVNLEKSLAIGGKLGGEAPAQISAHAGDQDDP